MLKPLAYSLPCLLILGCADVPDKYRDIHHLELPPVLPIEHVNPQPAVTADDMVAKEKTKSALAGLVAFEDDGDHPRLILKTRSERAWEMVTTALQLSDLEVLDKNREDNRIQLRYDADLGGKSVGWVNSLFLTNDYPEADYLITLTEGAGGVRVETKLSKPDELDPKDDASAQLLRLLHQTIDEKIINRDTQPKADN